MDIYNDSHQNYGAPKIAAQLQRSGEIISERTVGKYMRDLDIKAQWVKPFTRTTIDPDFSMKLQNILDEQFNPDAPMPCGAAILHTFPPLKDLSI